MPNVYYVCIVFRKTLVNLIEHSLLSKNRTQLCREYFFGNINVHSTWLNIGN